MVKQLGLFAPNFGAKSSYVFTQSPQKTSQLNPEFTALACWTNSLYYHNCSIDGGTSPEYFGYQLAQELNEEAGRYVGL
jgi:hypothetical protein